MCAGAHVSYVQILAIILKCVGSKQMGQFKEMSRSIPVQIGVMNYAFLSNTQDNPRRGRNYWLFAVWQPVQQGHKQHERRLRLGSLHPDQALKQRRL